MNESFLLAEDCLFQRQNLRSFFSEISAEAACQCIGWKQINQKLGNIENGNGQFRPSYQTVANLENSLNRPDEEDVCSEEQGG